MAASTAVSIRVVVSLEESEVVMKKKKKDKNYSLDLFPEESIESYEKNNKKERIPEKKFKAIWFKEDDFNRFLTMLNDPSIKNLIPKKESRRNNRRLFWCIKELLRRINNPETKTEYQGTIDFASAEIELLHQDVKKLQESANSINEFIASMKNKKNKWWNLL